MMYALYQYLKVLVFGAEVATSNNSSDTEPPVKPEQELNPQTRYFTGEITSFSDSSGMIDQQV